MCATVRARGGFCGLTLWRSPRVGAGVRSALAPGEGDDGTLEDERTGLAMAANERAALAASLLLLADTRVRAGGSAGVAAGATPGARARASEHELFEAIVGLSYSGDVRMSVGAEAAGKIGSIAEGSAAPMREMYAPHLHELVEAGVLTTAADSGEVEWDASAAASALLHTHLPRAYAHACGERGAEGLRNALAAAVRASSARAALAGACTAGGRRGSAYLLAKLKKGILAPK